MPQYRPDTSIKLTIWATPKAKEMVDDICRKWEAAESDVIRITLEAMIPACRAKGFRAFLSERQMRDLATPFSKGDSDSFSMKFTVRTSRATKRGIEALTGRKEHSQAEVMRYAWAAGFPLALRHGVSHLLALRETEIARAKKAAKTKRR